MRQLSLFGLLGDDYKALATPTESNDWKWRLADGYPTQKNGLNVFSCFACGGGSTMGYKLAGCNVLGCCEIDPKMNEIYVANHHPKLNYLMDIREFNNIPIEELPQELFNLDILDGSPPCTPFSMAGKREETWGKKKKFREGQKGQTLDDLLFVFIETVKNLQPKVAIMENVEGLMKGNAWKYVQKIYKTFHDIGYSVKHWLLKGETMGVPQTRHRVFFVATRLNYDLNKLDMFFNYKPITYGMIKDGYKILNPESQTYQLCKLALPTENNIGDVNLRLNNKVSGFQTYMICDDDIVPTIRSKPDIIDRQEIKYIGEKTIIHSQTFPEDFNFVKDNYLNISYICGMSVPPVMIKRIIGRLIDSDLFKQGD